MKSSKSIDTLAKTLLERHKCIDVLVNCAGIFPMTGQTPLEGMLAVKLHCNVYVCCQGRCHCVLVMCVRTSLRPRDGRCMVSESACNSCIGKPWLLAFMQAPGPANPPPPPPTPSPPPRSLPLPVSTPIFHTDRYIRCSCWCCYDCYHRDWNTATVVVRIVVR